VWLQKKRNDQWTKRLASRIGNAIRNIVLKENIIDTGCTLKIFHAELIKNLVPWDGMHRFLPSLILMKGGTIKQIAVNHRPRLKGKSKYTNWGRLFKTLPDLCAVYWMKKKYIRIKEEDICELSE